MIQNCLINSKSEKEKKKILEEMQIESNEDLLIKILKNSKHFNSKISKIRSMIDGYYRGGETRMPV